MAYAYIGSELDHIAARPHTRRDNGQIVAIGGSLRGYPMLDVHLSPDEARTLAAELIAAADSFAEVAA